MGYSTENKTEVKLKWCYNLVLSVAKMGEQSTFDLTAHIPGA